MVIDIPVCDENAFSRIESYHQAHYYEQLSDCVACLYKQHFKSMDVVVWCEQLRQLYQLNENFLDDFISKAQRPKDSEGVVEAAISGSAHLIGKITEFIQNILPFNIGHSFFAAPVLDSVKYVSQVTEVIFSHTIHQSIKNLLFNQFKQDNNQIDAQTLAEVSKSLEADQPLNERIMEESRSLTINLLKLFMFREMLLQGKITQDTKEQDIRAAFLKYARLEHDKNDKIVAIIETFFIQQLNLLFENSFKGLYDFQQHLIDSERNDFDRWLSNLFETQESRQLFSRQIQLQFLKATRDFFVQKQNEKSFLGNHPILISIAIATIVALMAITVVSFIPIALSTLSMVSTGISFFAITLAASILIINNINRIYYARNPKQREQLQNEIDIFNQNITHIHNSIENTKQTASKEIEWLEKFRTINEVLFNHKDIMYGYHEAWVREYAARYRHAKVISSDLKSKIYQLVEKSSEQSQKLINAFRHGKKRTWLSFLADTKQFIEHKANNSAIEAFELRLKIREQILHIVSKLHYIPPQLSLFYTQTLGGQLSDLSFIQHFHQWHNHPYKRLCKSAENLYHLIEDSKIGDSLFKGDIDYRKLLKLPNITDAPNVKPCEISAYLRNSFHFLLSLTYPIKPGIGLDPLTQPIAPNDEFFLYRMLLFRQLAQIHSKNNTIEDQSIRLYIESFVQQYFNVSAKEIFDDILNQSYYMPSKSEFPTIKINNQVYVIDQLDYIVQSLTLDIACHTKPITPNSVLESYSRDYQEAIERKTPLKLISLNINQNDLKIHQSESFENYVRQLMEDAQGYIQYLKHNGAPKSYIECYQFNVLEQLIALQVDIIVDINRIGKESIDYSLVPLWKRIDNYVHKQPYQITKHSSLYRFLNLFRQNPETIYSFHLADEDIDEIKENIRPLLLPEPPKLVSSSMWARPSEAINSPYDEVIVKNL